ncbi:hypothetical protein CBL_02855 [Carabus blaptoides fortunei]
MDTCMDSPSWSGSGSTMSGALFGVNGDVELNSAENRSSSGVKVSGGLRMAAELIWRKRVDSDCRRVGVGVGARSGVVGMGEVFSSSQSMGLSLGILHGVLGRIPE